MVKKAYLTFAFTWLGLLILLMLDFFLKIEAIIRVISVVCICKSKDNKTWTRKIREWFEQDFFEKNFMLSSYEIDTFEK